MAYVEAAMYQKEFSICYACGENDKTCSSPTVTTVSLVHNTIYLSMCIY